MAPSRGLIARAAILMASLLCHSRMGAADTVEVAVPPHEIHGEAYLCVPVKLPDRPLRLTAVDPLSEEQLVHHMLLYGCSSPGSNQPVWECTGHGVCGGSAQQILYGWGKNAPPMALPAGVGFQVGQGSAAHSLVLQVHFTGPRPAKDTSGVRLTLTPDRTPFMAGMLMYASTFHIPPGQASHLVPNRCCMGGFQPAHGFAFRVHTHGLGRSVYQDRLLPSGGVQRVVEHSPQLPQGFTPASNVTFWPGDVLEATCDFDSTGVSHGVSAGGTHHDEMCNLYFMMWSELPIFYTCFNSGTSFDRHGAGGIPASAGAVAEDAKHWKPPPMGQVSGVAQGPEGSLWVLQRAARIWDANSFSPSNQQLMTYTEAIREDTILRLDQDTGELLGSWGAGDLFMPHMISADREGNVWVTDAAAHVARKYSSQGKLLLQLGTPNKPGAGAHNFCKPTDVAVGSNGHVYVSDGYCNQRVVEFLANGTYLGEFTGALQTPHAVALDECKSRLYVASRESKEIVIFDYGSRTEIGRWHLARQGYIYDLAVGPYDVLFALCWDRDAPGSPTRLVQLVPDLEPAAGGNRGQWELPGVKAPHSLTVTAGPMRLADTARPVAVLVGETQPQGSRLHKFIILPAGEKLPADKKGQRFPSASQSYATMAASAKTANATAGSHVQPAAGGGKPGHHHTHQTRALLQDMSWDADRAASARLRSFLAIKPSGLQGHVHTAATSLQGLAGQVSAWAGSSAEWLAWLLYGGGASDVEEENLHGGLGLSLKHASIVGLPMGMLVLAMAGALWHLAGRDQ